MGFVNVAFRVGVAGLGAVHVIRLFFALLRGVILGVLSVAPVKSLCLSHESLRVCLATTAAKSVLHKTRRRC
eukprot:17976-Eustigmatos_ZCMA.PRE.1